MTLGPRFLAVGGVVALAGIASLALAQIEGNDRGVPPIDSSANYEVGGVAVDVRGPDAQAARSYGWRIAQRRGWKALWARANGLPEDQAPDLPDGTLDSIVAGISIEREEVGPHRYIARLGVLFDRGRAAALLGKGASGPRSAPMLVIPVMWSGGAPQSFEKRTEWQKAWARFRAGGSPIDYVRPYGNDLDPLLLNVAQAGRPGRGWWRMLLDRYAASDVVVPIVQLDRRWPGGPIVAHFRATHGPDGEEIARFDLVAPDSDSLPAMLDEGVRRIDDALAAALRAGGLIADPTLVDAPAAVPDPGDDQPVDEGATDIAPAEPATPTQGIELQVETPDPAAQAAAEASLRGVPGVSQVATTSLALGGVSVIRVRFAGDAAALRAAAATRGVTIDEGMRLRGWAP